MAIDFHYVPIKPDPISGQEVLDQTERAINELGTQLDETGDLAQSALDTANNAQSTANEGLREAQEAAAAALAAQTTADSATATANQALNTANSAASTANSALDTAAIAKTDASQALSTANSALSTAGSAQATAATAERNASDALTAAQAASATADRATGIFSVDDSVRDANEAYDGTEKSYLTNASASTPNLNFPAGLNSPYWFMAYITDDGRAATQTCWNDRSSLIYTRTAAIDNSDPENPIVTWSPWQSAATPSVVTSVDVLVNPAGQPAGTYLAIVMDTESGQATSYVNLTQITAGAFTAGNGGISISSDYKVSLQLDPNASQGLAIASTGLRTVAATAATATANGAAGSVIYAADNNTTARNMAATPAGVAAQINSASIFMKSPRTEMTIVDLNNTSLLAGNYACNVTVAEASTYVAPPGLFTILQTRRTGNGSIQQFWMERSKPIMYIRLYNENNSAAWSLYGPFDYRNMGEATSATSSANGEIGAVRLAADSNTTARNMAATPAGVAAQIATAVTATGTVPTGRTINTTAPLTGGGDLSANRTLAINAATAATATANGAAGSVIYAADNNTTARNMAATPAGVTAAVAALKNQTMRADLAATAQQLSDRTLAPGLYTTTTVAEDAATYNVPVGAFQVLHMPRAYDNCVHQLWFQYNGTNCYFRLGAGSGDPLVITWRLDGPLDFRYANSLRPATAATATAAGQAGTVVYAADNALATARNQAATPAGVAAQMAARFTYSTAAPTGAATEGAFWFQIEA